MREQIRVKSSNLKGLAAASAVSYKIKETNKEN